MRPKFLRRRREFATRAPFAQFRIQRVALMAVRITHVLPLACDAMQGVVGQVFAQPIAAVIGEPQFLGIRMERHAHAVAHAFHHRFQHALVGVNAHDLRVSIRRHANIARRADIEIQPIVRPQRHELPAMRLVLGQRVEYHFRLAGVVEIVFDIAESENARQFRDVQIAVVEHHTVGPIQPFEDGFYFTLATAVDDGVHVVDEPGADKHRTFRAHCDRTRIGQAFGPQLDAKARRQFDLAELHVRRGLGGQPRRIRRERGTFHRVGAALLPGRRRWRRDRRLHRLRLRRTLRLHRGLLRGRVQRGEPQRARDEHETWS